MIGTSPYDKYIITNDFNFIGGPLNKYYSSKVVFKGNSLVTYFRATNEKKAVIDDTIDVIEVIATNTVDPDTPNKMTYSLKDVVSGEKLIQTLYKHQTV